MIFKRRVTIMQRDINRVTIVYFGLIKILRYRRDEAEVLGNEKRIKMVMQREIQFLQIIHDEKYISSQL